MQVHIDRNGERYGPYSLEEVNTYLMDGSLLPADQAWQDGMADWVPIDQIAGVVMPGGTAAPPSPPAPAAGATCPQCQAPVEASQVICMGCGTQLQRAPIAVKGGSKKALFISLGVAGVIGLAVGSYFLFFNKEEGEEQAKGDPKPKVEAKSEVKKPEQPETPTKKDDTEGWVSDPNDRNNVVIEKWIRNHLKKSEGEITKADLEKITHLNLIYARLTEVPKELEKLTLLRWMSLQHNNLTEMPKGLDKLTQLRDLDLTDNPALTKDQIAELQKALPRCHIESNPT